MAARDQDDAAIERLRALIRIPTVSRQLPEVADETQFEAFRALLATLYPRTHARLEREIVAGGSLLFRWAGRGLGDPAVLMAHYDVVPADEPGWTHPAFGAEVTGEGTDRRIWGRGAIDDKGMLASIIEAVETALAAGVTPERDVYLSFGHNEETQGAGAEAIVDLLESRGIRAGLVIDEGGAIVEGLLPGVEGPIAMIGLSEKGVAGVELIAEKQGGHAATPAANGATALLARAILALEAHPSRVELPEPSIAMLQAVSQRATGARGWLYRHARALRGPLARTMARSGPEQAAVVRTTRAVTRLSGSAGDNVLAERATAMVNVRIAIGSTVEREVSDIRAVVGDGIQVRLAYGSDPPPVSRREGPTWDALTRAIAETFPRTIPSPFIMIQASDARHFTRISDTVYRFLPFDLTLGEREALHAIDESIRVSTYLDGIRFFRRLIEEL
jgi:carboxypeptidase PM20D1